MAFMSFSIDAISMHKDLSVDTKIYHMYKLKNFEYLLNDKKLFLNKIDKWKDPYELPYRAFGPDVRVENGRIMKDNYTDEQFKKIISDPIIAELSYMNNELKHNCGAICFNREFDKEAMWENYTRDEDGSYGVCVETTIGDFIESIEKNYDSLFVGPVQYFDFLSNPKLLLLNDQRRHYPKNFWMGFIKRMQYEYENEVRFIFDYNVYNSCINIENDKYTIDRPNVDIKRYIRRIILAPEFSKDKNLNKDEIINSFKAKYKLNDINVELSILFNYKKFDFPEFNEKEISAIRLIPSFPKDAKILYIKDSNGNFVKIK